ncbi:hypothetical protein Tco_0536990, partial [Tanacetum coccineum]
IVAASYGTVLASCQRRTLWLSGISNVVVSELSFVKVYKLSELANLSCRFNELRNSKLDTSVYSELRNSEFQVNLRLVFFRAILWNQELCSKLFFAAADCLYIMANNEFDFIVGVKENGGPERPRVYSDLSPKDKERYNADIRATNILLQGFPKDIYSLINHYTDAKDMWDNVKMLLEGSELTKEDRESQLYNDFEHFRQHKGETIHDYYGLQNRGKGNNARGAGAAGYGGAQNRVDRDTLLMEDVDEQPVQDLALNVDNVFQADDCDAFDYDVDEAPMAQTMFMANLSSAYPIYDEVGPSYDSDILSEVHDYDHYQDAICEHHEEHEMHDDVQPNYVVDSHANLYGVIVIFDSVMISIVKDNVVPAVPKFELTEREQKIDEQLRIVITDRNIKEENLKKELHSVKMQIASTNQPNKSMVEEVTL